MTARSVRVIYQNGDGYAQWLDGWKVKTRRLDMEPAALRRFFNKFLYVIVGEDVRKILRISGSSYRVKDFLEILLHGR